MRIWIERLKRVTATVTVHGFKGSEVQGFRGSRVQRFRGLGLRAGMMGFQPLNLIP